MPVKEREWLRTDNRRSRKGNACLARRNTTPSRCFDEAMASTLRRAFDCIGPKVEAVLTEQRFKELADKWKEETGHFSNVNKRWTDLWYSQIIGLGEAAVPLILRDLVDNGPDDWFWALTAITGCNPITKDSAGNMRAMAEAWIKWGKQWGYLNDCQNTSSDGFQD
jgi:hypothetical protein